MQDAEVCSGGDQAFPIKPVLSLEHVRIEYTGADCGCIMVSCNTNVTESKGAILFTQPSSMFLTSSVIAHGRGHGVVQGFDGNALDWLQGNDFEDLSGCRQTLPRDAEAHCSAPMLSCN